VNQAAELRGVFAEGDGAVKVRLEFVAAPATGIAHKQLGRQQTFAALYALRRADRLQRVEAFLADGKTRDVDEGDAAKTAIGREEDGKDAANYGYQWRDEAGTLLGALDSSLSL
jgi:hypothetical protein